MRWQIPLLFAVPLVGLLLTCRREPEAHRGAVELSGSAAVDAGHSQTVELRWRFQRGQSWRLHTERTGRFHTLQGEEIRTEATRLHRLTVIRSDADGADLIVVLLSFRQKLDSQGRQLDYDSTRAGASLAEQDLEVLWLTALLGNPLRLRLDRAARVLSVDSPDGFAALSAKLSELRARQGLAAALPPTDPDSLEVRLKSLATPSRWQPYFPLLPERPVAAGDSWQEQLTLPALMGSTVTHELRYSLSDPSSPQGVRISLRSQGRLEPSAALRRLVETSSTRMAGHFIWSPSGQLEKLERSLDSTVTFRPAALPAGPPVHRPHFELRITRLAD